MEKVIVLACIVLALLVAGCASEEAPAAPSAPAAPAPRAAAPEAPAAAPEDNLDACLSDCESIYTKETQKGVLLSCKAKGCYTKAATAARDIEVCAPIKVLAGPDPQREYRHCVEEVAIVMKDVSLCGRFEGKESNLCKQTVALRLRDPSICPSISDQVMRMACEGETGR